MLCAEAFSTFSSWARRHSGYITTHWSDFNTFTSKWEQRKSRCGYLGGFFLLKCAELSTTVELVSGDDAKYDRRW